jgi:spore coat protein CotF
MMAASAITETSIASLKNIEVREVISADLTQLIALEKRCFASDRLSKRSFSYWIK